MLSKTELQRLTMDLGGTLHVKCTNQGSKYLQADPDMNNNSCAGTIEDIGYDGVQSIPDKWNSIFDVCV